MVKDKNCLGKSLYRLIVTLFALFGAVNIYAGISTYENYPFPIVDTNTLYNNYDGYLNAPNFSISSAFAALKEDGSIVAWGFPDYGGSGAPTDNGYVKIYSNSGAFAALKEDGSIVAWGFPDYGGSGAPTDNGYVKIYSTPSAFAALKEDGSIVTWGDPDYGGSGAPTDNGYVKIYSNSNAFAALKADGSITVWGYAERGGSGAPTDNGYVKIYSTRNSFAALKVDGSIVTWGSLTSDSVHGIKFPTDSGYIEVHSINKSFAALKEDGSLHIWGFDANDGFVGRGYTKIYSTGTAFAALKEDGSIEAWGSSYNGGSGVPTDNGYVKVFSNGSAFAALKADGSITVWGDSERGGSGAPTDNGYVKVYSTELAFAALKEDGTITAWGNAERGGNGAPTGKFSKIYSNGSVFVAYKNDGTIVAWGYPDYGGTGAPESVASTDAVLNIIPSKATVKAGESFDVSIEIDKAQDLYGIQSTVLVDKPEYLNISAISYGDLFDRDNRLEIPNEDSALSQSTNEKVSIAISLKNPANPVNGSGTFAKMTYRVPLNAYGEVKFTPTNVVFSDKDGQTLASTFVAAAIDITNSIFTANGKSVNGTVVFPPNTNIDNTTITLQNSEGDLYTTTVDADGNFTIADLKDGTYTIWADSYPYFSLSTTVLIQDSQVVNIGIIKMLSGDTNADNAIDIGDVTLIANYFGQNTVDIPSVDSGVDLNTDGVVNIQDLAIVGNNFGIER